MPHSTLKKSFSIEESIPPNSIDFYDEYGYEPIKSKFGRDFYSTKIPVVLEDKRWHFRLDDGDTLNLHAVLKILEVFEVFNFNESDSSARLDFVGTNDGRCISVHIEQCEIEYANWLCDVMSTFEDEECCDLNASQDYFGHGFSGLDDYGEFLTQHEINVLSAWIDEKDIAAVQFAFDHLNCGILLEQNLEPILTARHKSKLDAVNNEIHGLKSLQELLREFVLESSTKTDIFWKRWRDLQGITLPRPLCTILLDSWANDTSPEAHSGATDIAEFLRWALHEPEAILEELSNTEDGKLVVSVLQNHFQCTELLPPWYRRPKGREQVSRFRNLTIWQAGVRDKYFPKKSKLPD